MKRLLISLLVAAMILSLCACGASSKNLFDSIVESEINVDSIISKYGYSDLKDQFGEIYYEEEFFGYSGRLYFDTTYKEVTWLYIKGDESQKEFESIVSFFIKKFDKQYGEHIVDGSYYIWHDTLNNRISIEPREDRFWVHKY